jgi:PAS domain S-box-containing protein
LPAPARGRSAGSGARLIAAGGVLAVVALLVVNGMCDFGLHTWRGVVLGALGFGAAAVLCVVAWWLTRQFEQVTVQASASARRLAGAEQTGQELIWEIAPDSTVTYMSGVARSMFGVEPEEVVGQSVFVLLPEHEHHKAGALLRECVDLRRGWTGVAFEALHADGLLRWVETTSVARLDRAGNLIGFTATTRSLPAGAVQQIEHDRVRARIQAMLDTGALHTVFQPIVDVRSGFAVGYEALTRFDAEPAQPPDRWFADAESVGLGVELDCLALSTALRAAQRIPLACYLSVNVTPATLRSVGLDQLLNSAPISSKQVVIEITEHSSVADYHELRAPMAQLRALGVRFAVDDAGSGYASFRHILQLRPEIIKLDREIVHDLHLDPARRALAAAVVMFARDVGSTVTAEGVEVDNQLRVLADLGIETAQGYLLGRPTDELALAPDVDGRRVIS